MKKYEYLDLKDGNQINSPLFDFLSMQYRHCMSADLGNKLILALPNQLFNNWLQTKRYIGNTICKN